ncbi:glycosyl transferase [Dictyobacter vulcani]|uniref:Glycosyl transferase n=1 Tax=Dictyobacter vulcani TaxID=2607529 RepID=A0A5J4KFG0_9CHLR|nr:glycosyltransferase [Dictyobacter vulcani]GER86353.1 glycosyl transferase [Dictyobacter vulcani]
MNTLFHFEHKVQNPVDRQSATKICMYLQGSARNNTCIMREATALVEAGYSVFIVDIETDCSRSATEELHGIRLKHIMMPSWFIPTRFKPWFIVKLVQVFILATLRLSSTPAEVYHAHDEIALPACYIVAWLQHKKLIFEAHEMPLSTAVVKKWKKLHSISQFILSHMMPLCAGVITVSPPLTQEIRACYGGPEISLVRNIPPLRVVPKKDLLRQYLRLRPNVRIALYQGNLQSDRGLDLLVHTAKFLEQNIVIVMMGESFEPTRSQLYTLIAKEKVAEQIRIIPPVPYEELLDWTASADIGLTILPPDYSVSIRMCLPNKFFEYLMAGLPVLSSPLDAISDIIRTYGVGQIVSPLTPAAIGAAINTFIHDHNALAVMRDNALNAAHNEFYWEKEKQQLIRLYRKVLMEQKERALS